MQNNVYFYMGTLGLEASTKPLFSLINGKMNKKENYHPFNG